MTFPREQIIEWAREADLAGEAGRLFFMATMTPETLARFAALVAQAVRAAENEACAQEADAHASVEGIAQRIAAAIRARITTQPETQND